MASTFVRSHALGWALLATGCAFFAGACSKESKPVAEDPRVPPASATGDAAEAANEESKAEADQVAVGKEVPSKPPAALKAEVSEESFHLKLASSESYEVGKAGQVEIVLQAKPPFKVNQEYPYSFAIDASPGVSFASMKLTKDAVKLEEQRASLSVPFTPDDAGERTISGTFKFSVCTDEQCLIKKHDLGTSVKVE